MKRGYDLVRIGNVDGVAFFHAREEPFIPERQILLLQASLFAHFAPLPLLYPTISRHMHCTPRPQVSLLTTRTARASPAIQVLDVLRDVSAVSLSIVHCKRTLKLGSYRGCPVVVEQEFFL